MVVSNAEALDYGCLPRGKQLRGGRALAPALGPRLSGVHTAGAGRSKGRSMHAYENIHSFRDIMPRTDSMNETESVHPLKKCVTSPSCSCQVTK